MLKEKERPLEAFCKVGRESQKRDRGQSGAAEELGAEQRLSQPWEGLQAPVSSDGSGAQWWAGVRDCSSLARGIFRIWVVGRITIL